MSYVMAGTIAFVLIGLLFVGVMLVGLQEADDPTESRPEDLSDFERHHVHRSDVDSTR